MRDDFKRLTSAPSLSEVIDWIRDVTRSRSFDIDDYSDQVSGNPFIFEVPSSSTDTIGTEKVGDISTDSGFLYVVVDSAGTLEWRRVAISSF